MMTSPTSQIDKSNNCISQFFQRKPKPKTDNDYNLNRLRAEEKRDDVIVLDDDSDDDLDSNKLNIVDLTEDSKPNISSVDKHNAGVPNDSISLEDDADVVTKDLNLPGTDAKSSNEQETSNEQQNLVSSPAKNPTPEKKKENSFAKFAHGSSVGLESRVTNAVRTTWHQHSSSTRVNKRPNDENGRNNPRSKKIHTCTKDEKKKEKEFVKMKDIPPEQQIKIIRKWHSMADHTASLEHRRYQVLLAARLHARCQEPTVRKAIQKLREHFVSRSESKTITVEDVANSDPEELAGFISSLQFYNVKAKQIVKAAQEIKDRHGGIVPEDEFSLLQITGIGKTFADLLAFVNKRETHEKLTSESVPV